MITSKVSPKLDLASFKDDFETLSKNNHSALSQLIPNLQSEASIDFAASLQQDVEEFTSAVKDLACNFFSLFCEEEEVSDVLTSRQEVETQLASLVKAERIIRDNQESILSHIEAVQSEMKVKPNDLHIQKTGNEMIQKASLNFLKNHKEWLLNIKEQSQAINQLRMLEGQPQMIDLESIDSKINAVTSLIEENDLSTQSPACSLTDYLSEVITQSTPNQLLSLSTNIAQFVTDLCPQEKTPDEQEKALQKLIQEMQTGSKELSVDDLNLLTDQLQKVLEAKKSLSLDEGVVEQKIKGFILDQISEYPMATKVFVNILAISIGTFFGGPTGGFAAKAAVDKIMQELLPESSPDTKAAKISAGIVEFLGAFCTGGVRAAVVSGGSTVFKETAPQSVQNAVETASLAYVANKTGLSITASIGLGIGMLVVLRNLKVLRSIGSDFKHGWKVLKESPIKAPFKFCAFAMIHAKDHLSNTVTALRQGRKIEAIIRIATIAFGTLGVIISIGTLPLTLAIFYVMNKTYESKFEGPANLHNPAFKEYVVQEYNDSGMQPASLRQILLAENSENEEFKDLCDFLDEQLTKKTN